MSEESSEEEYQEKKKSKKKINALSKQKLKELAEENLHVGVETKSNDNHQFYSHILNYTASSTSASPPLTTSQTNSTTTSSSSSTTTSNQRRSLFKDDQWITQKVIQNSSLATTVEKWSFQSSIPFQTTKLSILPQHNEDDKTLLDPYQCKQLGEINKEQQAEREDDLPMPKKKTGKKLDSTDEEFKQVFELYQQNDFYLHAGGTVNGIHFSDSIQIDNQTQTCFQYVAICTSGIGWYGDREEKHETEVESTSRLPVPPHLVGMGVGYDYPHEVADWTSPYSHTPNILQIYQIKTKLHDPLLIQPVNESTILSVELIYCVGFDSIGPIWDVKWCPEDLHNSFKLLSSSDSILGTIAVVSGDGKCRVLVLPVPEIVTESPQSISVTVPDDYSIPNTLRHVPLLHESNLCRWELCLPSECVLSIAWGGGHGSGNDGKNEGISPLFLACGLSTGAIAIWDLSISTLRHSNNNHDSSNNSNDNDEMVVVGDSNLVTSTVPFFKFLDLSVRAGNTATSNSRAIVGGVRTLSFCPYNGDLLASGGYDGSVKIWHVNDHFKPLYFREEGGNWVYTIEWNRDGFGINWGLAGSQTLYFDQLWAQNNPPSTASSRSLVHSHPSNYCGINKIRNFPMSHSITKYSKKINYNMLKNINYSIGSDGSLIGSNYGLKKQRRTSSIQLYRIKNVTMIEIADEQQNQFLKCCEIEINNQIEDLKNDLNTNILNSTVALLAIHSAPFLTSTGSSTSSGDSSDLHLVAYGGQAGLVRVHFFHPSLLNSRIQVFQQQQQKKKPSEE